MKLLIVDDDQASIRQWVKTLGKYYCVLDNASDGQTALSMIQQWDYDAMGAFSLLGGGYVGN